MERVCDTEIFQAMTDGILPTCDGADDQVWMTGAGHRDPAEFVAAVFDAARVAYGAAEAGDWLTWLDGFDGAATQVVHGWLALNSDGELTFADGPTDGGEAVTWIAWGGPIPS